MNNNRWREVERIFDETLEQPELDRAAFMAQACAGDDTLRHEVESLLAAHQQAGGFLVASAAKLSSVNYGTTAMSARQRIGPYQLLREIAQGGMGVVWLAERADDQYRQQVAIKLIKAGASNADIAHRLRHERQILADLNHPNIARLLDGGTTESGQPYLVMEYIEGVPIDAYCQQQQLTLRARLQLFRQVCAAVQYAHQHLIIHRDLKPANILVTADGAPKLLDFGIAKLLQPNLADSHHTQSGLHPMTPAYASPEQMRGESLTTASDVYSLGVVLYELLTGRSPYQLTTNTFGELSRAICEQDPIKPSIAVTQSHSSNEERLPSSLRTPHSAFRTLKGDLDSIVLMALRKEPRARYSSVEQFSEDIQRYLDGLPTLARKGTLAYRAVKYVRRYKVPVAAAALILLSLLGGIGATARQAQIARAEQAKAEVQRLRAEQALAVADQQRRRAEQALAEVKAERTRTEDALTTAEERRKQAEVARNEADQQRTEAESQKAFADEQRARAEQGEETKRQFLYAAQMKLAQQAWESSNIERMQELLDAQLPQPGQRDLRGFEWYYFWRLAHSDLVTIKHEGAVNSIVVTPDGAKMASQTSDGGIRIWDTATGKELPRIHDGETNATCLTISPDGQFFAQGKANGKIKIYSVSNGAPLATLEASQQVITAIAFAPDGKLLAASTFDGMVGVWAVPTWQRQALFKVSPNSINTIVFAPDSKQLITSGTAGTDTTQVWNPHNGQRLRSMSQIEKAAYKMAFIPGSNNLVTGDTDGPIRIWDFATGRLLTQMKTTWASGGLICSPDGRIIASGHFEQVVRLWDARTGALLTEVKGHSGPLMALAFTPDGKGLFTGSQDRTLKFRNVQKASEAREIANNGILSVVFSRDGHRLISTNYSQEVRLHDLTTGMALQRLKGHQQKPLAAGDTTMMMKVAVSLAGKYFATAGYDGTVRTWDEETGKPLQVFSGHTGGLYALAISPDGQHIASGGSDLTMKIWDTTSGRELHTLSGHRRRIRGAAFAPHEKILVTCSEDGTIKIWDYLKGVEIATTKPYTSGIYDLAFSPDGRWLALGGNDRYIILLDTTTWRTVKTLKGHAQIVYAIKFSPDGKRLASASRDSTTRLWELEQGQEVLSLRRQGDSPMMDLAFSPDGTSLAAVTMKGELFVWPVITQQEISAYSGAQNRPLRANQSDDAVRSLLAVQPLSTSSAALPDIPDQKIYGWVKGPNGDSLRDLMNLYAMRLDSSVSLSHKTSALIIGKKEETKGFCTIMQGVRADHFRGRRVRFSGYLKSLGISRPAGLWMGVDGEGYMLKYSNTFKPASIEWVKYEMVLDVPEDSLNIVFGFLLQGEGHLWGDDFRLEIVDADVPVTDISGIRERNQAEFLRLPEQERLRLERGYKERAKTLPLKPVNMDFV